MKFKYIALVVSASLGTTAISYGSSMDNSYITPFKDTIPSITNENNTWGPQDRTGQYYLGLSVNAFVDGINSKGSSAGMNGTVGYNINNYMGVQFSQFATINGMFGSLAEGVYNLSNSTMFTPYVLAGAGFANLAGDATGAWDVGTGVKFELSRNVQASIDYKYIQTMAANPTANVAQQSNARAGTNMIGAGVTWFFGGNNTTSNIAVISTVDENTVVPTVDESKYVLPQGIQQCEGNFNLTKNGVACYVVDGNNVTVYLDNKFAYDSNALNEQGKDAIKSFVKFIKDSDIDSVTIKGYASKGTDGQEYEIYNQKLSQKRADAVSDYMESLGVEDSMITTKGFGYDNPLVPNTSKENKAYNQRVQASVTAPLKKENS